MSDNDAELRDVLEEEERANIRGTLMHIGTTALSNVNKSDTYKMDPYVRECSIWIHRGMTREQLVEYMDSKLGLVPVKGSGHGKVTFSASGSVRIDQIEVSLDEANKVDGVEFKAK